jgi:hypothetical protein
MKFTKYDFDEGFWIADEQDYGDWKGFPILEVLDMCEYVGEDEVHPDERFVGSFNVVSLSMLTKEQIEEVKEGAGVDDEFTWNNITLAIELYRYGLYGPLKSYSGSSPYLLLREMLKELHFVFGMIGFFLDSPKNAIGHTGWDFLRGDLSLETAKENYERFTS